MGPGEINWSNVFWGAALGAGNGALSGAFPAGIVASVAGGFVTSGLFNAANQIASNGWRNICLKQLGVQTLIGGASNILGGAVGRAYFNLLANPSVKGSAFSAMNFAQSMNAASSQWASFASNVTLPVSLGGFQPGR